MSVKVRSRASKTQKAASIKTHKPCRRATACMSQVPREAGHLHEALDLLAQRRGQAIEAPYVGDWLMAHDRAHGCEKQGAGIVCAIMHAPRPESAGAPGRFHGRLVVYTRLWLTASCMGQTRELMWGGAIHCLTREGQMSSYSVHQRDPIGGWPSTLGAPLDRPPQGANAAGDVGGRHPLHP